MCPREKGVGTSAILDELLVVNNSISSISYISGVLTKRSKTFGSKALSMLEISSKVNCYPWALEKSEIASYKSLSKASRGCTPKFTS